jgi:hypothetical protein
MVHLASNKFCTHHEIDDSRYEAALNKPGHRLLNWLQALAERKEHPTTRPYSSADDWAHDCFFSGEFKIESNEYIKPRSITHLAFQRAWRCLATTL